MRSLPPPRRTRASTWPRRPSPTRWEISGASRRPPSRAAAKGAARGARLLVARARLRESYALDRLGRIPEAARAGEEAGRIYAEAGDRAGWRKR